MSKTKNQKKLLKILNEISKLDQSDKEIHEFEFIHPL